jgi:hypothetical protein
LRVAQRTKVKRRQHFAGGVFFSVGAGEMNRTPDLLITNELLYRLSYTGFLFAGQPAIIANLRNCPAGANDGALFAGCDLLAQSALGNWY